MPETYSNFGMTFMYPDGWRLDEDEQEASVTVESPTGAFMTVSRFSDWDAPAVASQARQAMSGEYEEVEEESVAREIAGVHWQGFIQRFAYLDLLVTSHLLAAQHGDWVYLVQIQAEDRELDELRLVFDAMLTALCQAWQSVQPQG